MIYESHVTVTGADVDAFKSACSELGVRPLLIELQSRVGGVYEQLMSSNEYEASSPGAAIDAAVVLGGQFVDRGFSVSRVKVETVPENPIVPTHKNGGPFSEGQYLETHFKTETTEYDALRAAAVLAQRLSYNVKVHVSRSAWSSTHRYLTMRSRQHLETHRIMEDFVRGIVVLGYGLTVTKETTECGVHDSNHSLDAEWTR